MKCMRSTKEAGKSSISRSRRGAPSSSAASFASSDGCTGGPPSDDLFFKGRLVSIESAIVFDNRRLGIRKEDLPKYEEQLELKIARAQLEDLKKDAPETMETQKKREELKDEQMADVKSLDIRNFI